MSNNTLASQDGCPACGRYPGHDGSCPYRHPWCLRCPTHATEYGIACHWHWGVLSEKTQAAILEHLYGRCSCDSAKRKRGGKVHNRTEAIWIVAIHGNAREEWKRQQQIEDAEDAEDAAAGYAI